MAGFPSNFSPPGKIPEDNSPVRPKKNPFSGRRKGEEISVPALAQKTISSSAVSVSTRDKVEMMVNEMFDVCLDLEGSGFPIERIKEQLKEDLPDLMEEVKNYNFSEFSDKEGTMRGFAKTPRRVVSPKDLHQKTLQLSENVFSLLDDESVKSSPKKEEGEVIIEYFWHRDKNNQRFLNTEFSVGHGSFKKVNLGIDVESGEFIVGTFQRSGLGLAQREISLQSKINKKNPGSAPEILAHQINQRMGCVTFQPLASGDLSGELKNKDLPIDKKLNFALQVAKRVLETQNMKIYNRDIKTDNFLVFSNGTVKMTDFGMASRRKISYADPEKGITASRVGTRYYMAPEILSATGRENLDYEKSDWWSMGQTFSEIFGKEIKAASEELHSHIQSIGRGGKSLCEEDLIQRHNEYAQEYSNLEQILEDLPDGSNKLLVGLVLKTLHPVPDSRLSPSGVIGILENIGFDN